MPSLTSAGGALVLLQDANPTVKGFAVQKLLEIVDDFWAEIADVIADVEVLYEDSSFPQREHAALLASKVFFHLGELDDALTYAMGAGSQFNLAEKSLFVNTLVSEAIDKYSKLRREEADIDAALDHVVDGMFQQCLKTGNLKQAIGVSLESRRLDIIEAALHHSKSDSELLEYTYELVMTLLNNRSFKDQVLNVLAHAYEQIPNSDVFHMARCYVALGNAEKLAALIKSLVSQGDKQVLMAYQLCFDLYSSSKQVLIVKLRGVIKEFEELDQGVKDKIDSILSGALSLGLQVDFLSHKSKFDALLLKNTKDAVGAGSVYHSGVILSHMLMAAGTTSDGFLRENKDWLMKAQNWSKFSAVSSIGVIHMGHVSQARALLKPYLAASNAYEKSGGLYAMGLINANHGQGVLSFLTEELSTASTEVVQHGAALGLGLAAMGCADGNVQEALQNTLAMDSAVAGEAAGVAMGLNMMGTGQQDSLSYMFQYAQDTQHEKIIRGLSLGISLILQGRQEQASDMIQQLYANTDPIIRAGACHSYATAYAGTGNTAVTRKLLHIAVSDASDDVRRAAATAIGFVMLRQPDQVPTLLALLSESFNPHVRAGCCMAMGVACAATGSTAALTLIEPMIKDSTPFVRQSAFIAQALILLQAGKDHAKAKAFRESLTVAVGDQTQPLLAKFGAIVAQGILHAGGQNVTIKPCPSHGHVDDSSLAGLLMFTQFWYWFPYTHLLSLALKPTALICLNKDLKMPQIDVFSDAKPSTFAPFPKTEPPKEKNQEKVKTAVLSITSKAQKQKKDKMAVEEDKQEEKKEEKEEKVEEEADNEYLSNPARVVKGQLCHISIPADCRYQPAVLPLREDVIILTDSTPGEEEVILHLTQAKEASGTDNDSGTEPSPPPAFEFDVSKEDEE